MRAKAAGRRMTCFLIIMIAAGFCAASTVPREADAAEVIYSPWTKFCLVGDICFIGMDIHLASECRTVVAVAVLIEQDGETKKTLRITLPHVRTGDGVRIGIDGGPPVQRSFEKCHSNGCMADYEAGPELTEELRHGQMLVLEAIDADNSPIRSTLPLASFAQAYDGPPVQPHVFEEKQGALQKELERRARGEAEAKPPITRCGGR
jgi:invasion protein IalB